MISKNAQAVVFDLHQLMERTTKMRASDLHLAPGRPPAFRVDGDLKFPDDLPVLSAKDTEALAVQIASAGQWKQFCENREMDFSISQSGIGRFRVNLYWQRGSVAVALRAIPYVIPTPDDLGLPDILRRFAAVDHGLFLVSGPTGSGKSTTLATMLDHINATRSCHIVTIEDPIEYLHGHKKALVNQREMHADTLSFGEALRHVLRQDPDVILVGEMRDLETIQTALTLAETGHLVLATLHTGDATQAITRILDVYPPHQQQQARTQLSLTLIAIMVQQLLRRRDGKGRVLAYEMLVGTPAISHMIRSGELQQVYSSIQSGGGEGMNSMNSSLLRLYREGKISRDDALHKTTRQKELLELLSGSR